MIDTGVLFIAGTGTAAWAAAGWQGVRQWQAERGHRVAGIVIGVSAAARGGASSTVTFVDDEGVPRRVETNFRASIGQEVRLGFPAGRPQHARRIGGIAPWGFTIMGTVVGGVFVATATCVLTGTVPPFLTGR
ncbi:hypothetical protein ABH931_002688 [Streptacidiphilus sp. MAP12-33]|uniref:hypothetical protein n=1 Tax=Streptacidiphilus sp. MAP12-33 TaxID=3156266 RepID=UPI0035176FB8